LLFGKIDTVTGETNEIPAFDASGQLQSTGLIKTDITAEYVAATTYSEDNLVSYEGDIYKSKVSSNTGNTPDSSPTQWEIKGGGDVTGPASSVDNNIVTFDSTTGKIIQDSGYSLPTTAIVGKSDTQTLENKTLTDPIFDVSGTDADDDDDEDEEVIVSVIGNAISFTLKTIEDPEDPSKRISSTTANDIMEALGESELVTVEPLSEEDDSTDPPTVTTSDGTGIVNAMAADNLAIETFEISVVNGFQPESATCGIAFVNLDKFDVSATKFEVESSGYIYLSVIVDEENNKELDDPPFAISSYYPTAELKEVKHVIAEIIITKNRMQLHQHQFGEIRALMYGSCS